MIGSLFTHHSSHPKVSTSPSTPKMLLTREHIPTHYLSVVFTFELIVEFIRELGCRNPTLAKCEDETHTPKVGDLESSGTPECLEFDIKGQNTSP